MKKIKMFDFVKGFESLGNLEGFEFVLATTLNYEAFKIYITALEKAKNSNKDYQIYLGKLDVIIKEHAQKNDLGMFITSKDDRGRENYQIEPENRPLLREAMVKLDEKYLETIGEQKILDEKFTNDLDQDVTGHIEMINREHLPKNIKTKQLALVFDMVNWIIVTESPEQP